MTQQPCILVSHLCNAYTIQANIDYTPHTAVIKLLYIDKSKDTDIFSAYV